MPPATEGQMNLPILSLQSVWRFQELQSVTHTCKARTEKIVKYVESSKARKILWLSQMEITSIKQNLENLSKIDTSIKQNLSFAQLYAI